jgi:hypothetical protein
MLEATNDMKTTVANANGFTSGKYWSTTATRTVDIVKEAEFLRDVARCGSM